MHGSPRSGFGFADPEKMVFLAAVRGERTSKMFSVLREFMEF